MDAVAGALGLLLAVPTAAMATFCLVAGRGGPVLVMTLVLAARDFKFLDKVLRRAWRPSTCCRRERRE